jgi:hypothetical protein
MTSKTWGTGKGTESVMQGQTGTAVIVTSNVRLVCFSAKA